VTSVPSTTTTIVVGGGLLGIQLARQLVAHGPVTLVEAAPELGGLASAWQLGDVLWDKHYHVTLTSDKHTRALYDELGLHDQIIDAPAKSGLYAGGVMAPFSSPLDYLKLRTMSPIAKARIGATMVAGTLIKDGLRMEQIPAVTWLAKWSGPSATNDFWLPLLRAKLGDNAPLASAAFIWATIQRLGRARRAGVTGDLFGHVRGGYATVFEAVSRDLAAKGITMRLGAPVKEVRSGEVELASGEVLTADRIVLTAASPVVARIVPGLSDDERSRLAGVTYQGIVCASLLLRRPLTPYYLTYITDEAPFTAVVEMTALVDPAELGGHTLVYLPRYVPSDDPWLAKSKDEVREEFLPALKKMHPQLTDDDVLAFEVSFVRYVMPVPTLRYSDRLPPVRTSVPGVYVVSSCHLVNATLNVDDTLALAERLLPEVLG
jgi:protoporphyrinogen oxidase